MDTIASEGEVYPFATENEAWSISWHRPPTPPDGTPHGSSSIAAAAVAYHHDVTPLTIQSHLHADGYEEIYDRVSFVVGIIGQRPDRPDHHWPS